MDFSTRLGAELGKVPFKFLNQMNGKSANENYRNHKNREKRKRQQQSALEAYVMGVLKSGLQTALDEAFEPLFKGNK